MPDYKFFHTDPANGSFVVKPYTIDGLENPANANGLGLYNNAEAGIAAVSAHTSLVFTGKGVPEYGQEVQVNLLYVLENFAYKSRPLYPVQGQLWYKNQDYDDTANFPTDPLTKGLYIFDGQWIELLLNGSSIGPLDMNGNRIINLGSPINPTDAVNLTYADSNYLALTGGIITGPLTVNGNTTLTNTFIDGSLAITTGPVDMTTVNVNVSLPSANANVANKLYVDSEITTLSSSLPSLYVARSGSQMTGILDMNSNSIVNLPTPISLDDAASKRYVDTAIASIPAAQGDGVVYGGVLDGITGTLSLQRTEGLPDVIVSGNFSPYFHTHASTDVSFTHTLPYGMSYTLSAAQRGELVGYPTPLLYNVLRSLDNGVGALSRPAARQIIVQTVGGQVAFTLNDEMQYLVNSNKLQVYVNGTKQYCTEHSSSKIKFTMTNASLLADTGLAVGSYSFTVTINGTPYVMSVTVSTAPYTYVQLITDVQTQLISLSVPGTFRIDQYPGFLMGYFTANTSGSSTISTSYAVGELFESISDSSAPVNTNITTNLQYAEIGTPGTISNSILFASAPALSTTLEFVVLP